MKTVILYFKNFRWTHRIFATCIMLVFLWRADAATNSASEAIDLALLERAESFDPESAFALASKFRALNRYDAYIDYLFIAYAQKWPAAVQFVASADEVIVKYGDFKNEIPHAIIQDLNRRKSDPRRASRFLAARRLLEEGKLDEAQIAIKQMQQYGYGPELAYLKSLQSEHGLGVPADADAAALMLVKAADESCVFARLKVIRIVGSPAYATAMRERVRLHVYLSSYKKCRDVADRALKEAKDGPDNDIKSFVFARVSDAVIAYNEALMHLKFAGELPALTNIDKALIDMLKRATSGKVKPLEEFLKKN